MFKDRQSKNIIKIVTAVMVSVILGEGVLGLGFFWPFLLILLEWKWIYWLAVIVGILISSIYHISIGLPSLFLVAVVGGLSFIISSRKEIEWVMLVISLLANFVFDKVFGLHWSLWDVLSIIIVWTYANALFEKSETIKINY